MIKRGKTWRRGLRYKSHRRFSSTRRDHELFAIADSLDRVLYTLLFSTHLKKCKNYSKHEICFLLIGLRCLVSCLKHLLSLWIYCYYCYCGKDRFFIYGLILYSGSVVNCTNWRHDSCHDDIFSMVIDIRRLKRY